MDVKEQIYSIGQEDITGTLDSIIYRLQEIKTQLEAKGYFKISLEPDAGYNNICCDFYGLRKETVEEHEKRIAIKEQNKVMILKRKLNEFEKLRKEIGKLGGPNFDPISE